MRASRSPFVRFTASLLVAAATLCALSPALLSLSHGEASLGTETAYAQGAPAGGAAAAGATGAAAKNPAQDADKTATAAISVANGIVNGAFMLMNPILMLASWLLSPDWTYGDFFGMRPILHKLWVLVSNIVYVIFAIALLVIAILNVFGNSTYQIKTALPKFVGGIVMVPLSWFIVSAVLSIANILTASVLNLPYDTFTANTDLTTGNKLSEMLKETKIKSDCTLTFDKLSPGKPATGSAPASGAPAGGGTGGGSTGGGTAGGSAGGGAAASNTPTIDCGGESGPTITLEQLFNSDDSPYSILYVYAYGIFKVDSLDKIKSQTTINTVSDIIFGLFTGIIGFVVMLLLFIGIVFVLFTRVIQLWVFIILSPLFGLFFFLGENVLGDSALKKYTLKNFIGLAMVPVYISAALSFGMMLVLVVAKTDTAEQAASFGNDGYVQMETSADGQTETIKVGRNPDAQIKLTVKGSPLALGDGVAKGKEIGKGTIGKLLVMVLALMILWLGVMAGAKSNEFTASAIEPIESFGKGVGGTLMKLPQYMPLIPTGDGKTKMSYAGFSSFGSSVQSAVTTSASQTGSTFGSRVWGRLNSAIGGENDPQRQSVNNAINSGALGVRDPIQAGQKLEEQVLKPLAARHATLNDLARDVTSRGQLADAVMAVTIVPEADRKKVADAIRNAGNGNDVAKALKELDEKLGGSIGTDNLSTDWSQANAEATWSSLGGGSRTPATAPTSAAAPATPITPIAFSAPRTFPPVNATVAAPANARSLAAGITSMGSAFNRQDPAQVAGFRDWLRGQPGMDTAKTNEIMTELAKAPHNFVGIPALP